MTEDTHHPPTDTSDPSDAGDMSEVVEGPVGSATLRDPNSSGPRGADLNELPSLDRPGAGGSATSEDAPSDGDPSVHERQDPDHVGVDWELTAPTRE